MEKRENFLESCLFFNTNALSRHLLKLAEAQFNPLKISPAHASLLLVVYDAPGIGPKELAEALNLSPSTITRFVDALEKKKLVRRRASGKTAQITPTSKGLALKPAVAEAYKKLYFSYTGLLGDKTAKRLSFAIFNANQRLSDTLVKAKARE